MRQTITRVDDTSGTPIAMLSVTRDITRDRATAEAISRSEETLRLVVEGSPDFFFYIHDAEGIFTYVSPSVEAITGYSAEEWMSHYTRFLTDNPVNRDVVSLTENTLKTGEITPFYPVEVYHKDGRRIMLEVYERPILADGEVVGIRGVARDVTDLRRAEAAERAVRKEAEQHKRRFYRDTILSVTDGKLVICDRDEIDAFCCEPIVSALPIAQPQHVAIARDEVRAASERAGMDPSRIDDLMLCVGEAATNAYKHADGGLVMVGDEGDVIRVKVVDSGPGMDSLALPKLTLMKGYSTIHSLGMGYAAMLALADKIYLATDPSGTTVVIEFAKQPQPAALDVAGLPDSW